MRPILLIVLRFLHQTLDDCMFVCGAVLIVIGVEQIYSPAAWIMAGVFCLLAGLLYGRYLHAEEIG
jgi:hypothetical protein